MFYFSTVFISCSVLVHEMFYFGTYKILCSEMEHKIFKCSDSVHDCGHRSVFGHAMYQIRTRIRILFRFRTRTKKVYRLRTLFSGLFYFSTPSVHFSDTNTDTVHALFSFRTRTSIVFHKRTQIRIQYRMFGLRTGCSLFGRRDFLLA